VRGSNPTSASRLHLSRPGQPGSISALVLPPGGMAARHRKGVTAERLCDLEWPENMVPNNELARNPNGPHHRQLPVGKIDHRLCFVAVFRSMENMHSSLNQRKATEPTNQANRSYLDPQAPTIRNRYPKGQSKRKLPSALKPTQPHPNTSSAGNLERDSYWSYPQLSLMLPPNPGEAKSRADGEARQNSKSK
ncbi:hypothetical protein T265_13070, partial [Opisthorchis viverrini]